MIRSGIILLGLAMVVAMTARFTSAADDKEEGFKVIFDGKSMDGWKVAEHPETFKLKNGELVTGGGQRAHCFYVGDPKPFKNFELRVDVMTEPNSNGGIYFHTRYQESSWPKYGFEVQVNNSHSDWKRTGSLYDVVNVKETYVKDGEWYTETIIVKDNHVTTKVNDKVLVDYTEPADTKPGKDFTRKIDEGTFALQAHDPKSIVHYKNIRVKRLD